MLTGLLEKSEVKSPVPVADGGELLLRQPGVSGSRMGGRAIDPIIRGQKETQLNILLDGGYLHGGCPNRMDPPTAYTAADSYDSVTVIKGNRTVIYGGGGSGGTVLFERDWPQLNAEGYRAEITGSGRDNGDQWDLTADLAAGSEQGYLRLISHQGAAGDYDDGQGDPVNAGWKSESNTLLTGLQLSDDTRLQLSYEQVREEDIDFPGAPMDSPYADADNLRLRLEHQFSGAFLRTLRFELYNSDVEHLMENVMMTSPSSSDTRGGRLLLEAQTDQTNWRFGADMQTNQRKALAYMVMSGMPAFSQWPDVEISQQGLFAEADHTLNPDNQISAGMRYDHVRAEAGLVDASFGMGMMAATPAALYSSYYGSDTGVEKEDNLGGFVSWQHRFSPSYQLETVLSRSVRTADATERYVAKNAMTGDWIGNPELEPEKHHQLELALTGQQQQISWSLAGWYNRVDDYILRYRDGSNDLYRNIAAELYGAEAELTWQFQPAWQLSTSLNWLRGNNRESGQALSRIAPLELSTTLDYHRGNWRSALTWQLVAAQNDVCLSTDPACGGQDVRQTPGYGVLNLQAEYQANKSVTLNAGVDNLFDKAYSLHESRDSLLEPDPVQVLEPGRTLWLGFRLVM